MATQAEDITVTGNGEIWTTGAGNVCIGPTNLSGVTPLDLRVVVMPDPVEKKTAGGIILIDATQEREKYATVKATLIAVGENAWEEAASRSSHFTRPRPGDRVMIAKYGGVLFEGPDGNGYRIMNDEDVVGVLQED